MKSTGILFKADMVRALLRAPTDNPKTQTRRIAHLNDLCFAKAPDSDFLVWHACFTKSKTLASTGGAGNSLAEAQTNFARMYCPYGGPGDELWVRETFQKDGQEYYYRADTDNYQRSDKPRKPMPGDWVNRWTPSLLMPREACRMTLVIDEVRAERVQDITVEDAVAEGVSGALLPTGDDLIDITERDAAFNGRSPQLGHSPTLPITRYRLLWNSINLPPKPVYASRVAGQPRVIDHYTSFPWSLPDFEARYPGQHASGQHKGKPLIVTPNPFVWVLRFHAKPLEVRA